MREPTGGAHFDQFATGYDEALAQGIAVSGEDKLYFAEGRIAWLADRLRQAGEFPQRVLDFGCGTGTAVPFLIDRLGAKAVVGVDISEQSLALARAAHAGRPAQFFRFDQYTPAGEIDLAFCNGVFHHIPLAERDDAMRYILRSLRPGGWFALWENNPWSPGARLVMARIPFDREAIMVWPKEACRQLERNGFTVVATDFLFLFPRLLKFLRGLESGLSRLPLGAQYQVLCRKPLQ